MQKVHPRVILDNLEEEKIECPITDNAITDITLVQNQIIESVEEEVIEEIAIE